MTLHDGRVLEADRVVVNSSLDVALVKIRTKAEEKFASITFAGDDELLLGETVLALGNPFGLGGSVSRACGRAAGGRSGRQTGHGSLRCWSARFRPEAPATACRTSWVT